MTTIYVVGDDDAQRGEEEDKHEVTEIKGSGDTGDTTKHNKGLHKSVNKTSRLAVFTTVMFLPHLAWCGLCGLLPVNSPSSGVDWSNVPFLVYCMVAFTLCCPFMWVPIHLFYGVSMWRCHLATNFALLVAGPDMLSVATMIADQFPLPLHTVVCTPPFVSNNDRKIYVVVFTLAKESLTQMVISAVFNRVAFAARLTTPYCLKYLTAKNVRGPSPTTSPVDHDGTTSSNYALPKDDDGGDSEYKDRLTWMTLMYFYFFEVTHEMFTTFAMTNVTSAYTAGFMIMEEVVPLTFYCYRATDGYYDLVKAWYPRFLHGLSRVKHRRYITERYCLKMIAEVVAVVGFLTVAPTLRYGVNREYYPLQTSCHSDFMASTVYICSSLLCSMVIAVISYVFFRRYYELDLVSVTQDLVQRYWKGLMAMCSLSDGFPCLLMLYHSNVMQLFAGDEVYEKKMGC